MSIFRKESSEKLVLLFGQSGSGKSTICAVMSLFFHELEGVVPEIGAVSNPEGARLLRTWVRELRVGKFPKRTDAGTFTSITVGFRKIGSHEGLRFVLLEIAGEDVIVLDPLHVSHLARPELLDEWVESASAIVLVASTQAFADDRYILLGFCEYLHERGLIKPLCLVISEWDRVSSSGQTVLEYARENYGEVTRYVADAAGELLAFSVGTVDLSSNRIDSVDFSSGTMALVEWLMNTP